MIVCLLLIDIAVLHPRYKLAYFRMKKWPEGWITTAKSVAEEQWTAYYKPSDSSQSSASGSSQDDFFAEIDNFGKSSFHDELADYLNTAPIGSVEDPIKYWQQANDTALARMALDFLLTPGESTTF
ncbi:hypothetical protein DENSPDRAFT_789606 [Dentipellis sp. KUC8613]|nr:hypothetical protein DENSPDRAFT_789606 [Dentipellis sp. KUC8613]